MDDGCLKVGERLPGFLTCKPLMIMQMVFYVCMFVLLARS